jgi:hypothetical protein
LPPFPKRLIGTIRLRGACGGLQKLLYNEELIGLVAANKVDEG